MKKPRNAFGDELRRIRLKNGYSQAELAHLAGITAGYISQLETGAKLPTIHVTHLLSGPLGILPNCLLSKIGMIEMDFASTFKNNHKQLQNNCPSLSPIQIEELANYLTYLEFKTSVVEQTTSST